jgi:hypothetical protein
MGSRLYQGPACPTSKPNKALVISTGEHHQTAIDLVFAAVLAKLLFGCATHSGTKALASQKASTFFTLFLDRSSQLAGGNAGRR